MDTCQKIEQTSEIRLSEINVTEKATHCIIPFTWNARKGKAIKMESKLVVSVSGSRSRGEGLTANVDERSNWDDKNILKLGCNDGYTI